MLRNLGFGLALVLFLILAFETAHAGAPAGTYWTTFTLPKAPDCINDICMQSEIRRVSIIEESTTEILGDCEFQDSDFAESPSTRDEWFWCERHLDTASGNTEIKISSKQANLPILHVYYMSKSIAGIWFESLSHASDQVVHSPEGASYADPYQNSELKFAGFKQLMVDTKKMGIKLAQEATQALVEAGYEATMRRYDNGVGEIAVYNTKDARVLMEEKILAKKGWKVRKSATRGNLGTYDRLRLMVSTPFGISLIPQYRISNETPVSGTITVMREDGADVEDAVVTVNGTQLSPAADGTGYDVSSVALSPGQAVKIEVTSATQPKPIKIDLTCPSSFEISSPADGSRAVGSPLNVSWSAPITVIPDYSFIPAPVAGQYACKSGQTYSRMGTGDWFKRLTLGQTQVTLDDVSKDCDESFIEVRIASETAFDENYNMAICYLHQRVKLRGAHH